MKYVLWFFVIVGCAAGGVGVLAMLLWPLFLFSR